LKEIQEKNFDSIRIYNEFISYLCKNKEFSEAVNLLHELVAKDIVPNAETFQILMEKYWENGMMDEVYAIYQSSPTEKTRNMMINLFLQSDQLNSALEFLSHLSDDELKIDNYLPLIKYFIKSDNQVEVFRLIKEVKRMKFKINVQMMRGSENF
jgi:pentatricopeptide repeat protein